MIDKSLLMDRDPHIEDPAFLHLNRLPARANVVPSDRRGVYYRNKYDSPFCVP